MGGLLWGENNTLRLSLDRGDLWDERTHGEAEWWKKHPWTKAARQGRSVGYGYYNGVTPTKLPGGRLEITLPPGKSAKSFELNLATAEGLVEFADHSQLRAFYSAAVPVVLIRIPGEPSRPRPPSRRSRQGRQRRSQQRRRGQQTRLPGPQARQRGQCQVVRPGWRRWLPILRLHRNPTQPAPTPCWHWPSPPPTTSSRNRARRGPPARPRPLRQRHRHRLRRHAQTPRRLVA